MTDISRKEFLKLSGAAIASGALASSGLDSIANAQSRELLH
ncbi:MAG: twin-arginine translocation signal domain-containing protein, partial [Kordiimonadaceae bacterium]|nr:twin-arginine translocation signal domain-containing protein [Kordiimonadaceae bacterium]